MPDQTEHIPTGIEVTEPVIAHGKVGFSLSSPAPEKMKRVIKALNYFIAGLVTTVGATDLFSGRQSKIICFVLGVIVLALGALELATGVKPPETETKP